MTLAIHLTSTGDLEEVAEEGLRLRRELVDLHVGPVEAPRSGELPAGAKAATVQDRLAEEWLRRHDGGDNAESDHA